MPNACLCGIWWGDSKDASFLVIVEMKEASKLIPKNWTRWPVSGNELVSSGLQDFFGSCPTKSEEAANGRNKIQCEFF